MIIVRDDGSFIKICNCKYGTISCSCELDSDSTKFSVS